MTYTRYFGTKYFIFILQAVYPFRVALRLPGAFLFYPHKRGTASYTYKKASIEKFSVKMKDLSAF
jgi:hypothetical protein